MTSRYQLHLLEPTAQVLSNWLTEEESLKLTNGLKAVYEAFSKHHLLSSTEKSEASRVEPKICKHLMSCKVNAVRGFIQSFGVSYGVKVAAGVMATALRGGSKPWKQFQRSTLRALFGKDTLSFSLFIATFVAAYKSLLCVLRRLIGADKSWMSFVAGALAGSSILFDINHDRRVAIALYLSIRVAHFAFRWIWKHHIEPSSLVTKRRVPDQARRSSIRVKQVFSSVEMPNVARTGSHSSVASSSSNEALSIPQSGSETEFAAKHPDYDQHYREKQVIRRIVSPFLMAAASSQIFAAFQLAPQTLPVPYLSFLFTHAGVRHTHGSMYRQVQQQMQQLNLASNKIADLPLEGSGVTTLMDSYSRLQELSNGAMNLEQFVPRNLLLVNPGEPCSVHNPSIACNMLHYWTPSCTMATGYLWYTEFGRALKLYGSLYAVFTLLFRYKTVARDPVRVGKSFCFSTVRSAIFLATFVATAGAIGCTLRYFTKSDRAIVFYAAGALAGLLSLPIETPNRQLEIAYYCLPRAIESLWRQLCQKGYLFTVPVYDWLHVTKFVTTKTQRQGSGGEVIYFMIATGLMAFFYQNEPDVITSGYRKVLARFMQTN